MVHIVRTLKKWRSLNNAIVLMSVASCFGLLGLPSLAAAESSIPWQCTSYTYTGNSQAECIQSFNEGLQNPQEKIAQLERRLKRQEISMNELKDRMTRQARRQYPKQDHPAYSPSYDFVPVPPIGSGFSPLYGYRRPSFFGVGPLPFLPPLAIWID
ncbi:hypothetical protein [Nitrospira sp. M1]